MQNVWEFLAGLGIFLYAMYVLEDSIRHLAGRTTKLFLKRQTGTKLKAITSGAIVTGILQSSSVVSFMTLAFVGAGVISMRNALAVVIGSNFGTTLDSWVVALLGFRFSMESFSLPVIGVSGIAMVLAGEKRNLFHAFRFFFGFGMLFLGLSYMKDSIGVFVTGFDFTPYLSYDRIVFVLIGFVITALIQSSSATMVIVLSALNTGVLPLETAAALIIGSELGTSIKILLGAIGGIAAKKRVALGNIIFNAAITVVAFLCLDLLIPLVTDLMGIQEPLMALVMFQSVINLMGIFLFFPFMDAFSGILEKQFSRETGFATAFVCNVNPSVPEAALDAMEKEVKLFIIHVLHLNLEAFHIEEKIISWNGSLSPVHAKPIKSYSEQYDDVKRAEGEILSFYFRIREEKVDEEDVRRLDQLMASVRNGMYSAKGMKDIRHNRKDFRDSGDDVKYRHYRYFQSQLISFYKAVNETTGLRDKQHIFSELIRLLGMAQKDYDTRLQHIYRQAGGRSLEQNDISTLLNVSREIYSSQKAIIYSLRDFLLDYKAVEAFNNVPVETVR